MLALGGKAVMSMAGHLLKGKNMTDFNNRNDELSEQEIQYHIYLLFTELARKREKIEEYKRLIARLNMVLCKYK